MPSHRARAVVGVRWHSTHMSNTGDQHIYPASLIGMFSEQDLPTRRKRRVYVARRDLDKVLRQIAERAGLLGKPHDHIYDNHDALRPDLDDFWQDIEKTLPKLDESIHRVTTGGQLRTSTFVTVWVPYIAHLLARPPRITLSEHHDLRDGDSAPTDRYRLFATYADSFLMRTRWALLTTTPEHPFVSNDGGYTVLPGGPDEASAVVVPISRTIAIHLRVSTDPTFDRKQPRTPIPTHGWHADDVAALNDLMAHMAGREVYTATQEQADHALTVINGTATPHLSRVGVDPRVFAATAIEMTAHTLIGGAPTKDDPWGRYLIARHRYTCDCKAFRHPEPCPTTATSETDKQRFFDARQQWDRFQRRPDLNALCGDRTAAWGGEGIAWATTEGIATGPIPPGFAHSAEVWRRQGDPLRTT